MNNQSTMKQEEGAVDGLLRDFFQAEMPHPWPAMRLSYTTPARRVGSFWSNISGRFALAASIALLIAGYLTLSGYFPRQQATTGVESLQEIGTREKPRKAAAPPVNEDTPEPMLVPMPITSPGKKSR